jgi:hypothetical protein
MKKRKEKRRVKAAASVTSRSGNAAQFRMPRRVRDWLAEIGPVAEAEQIFDAFWREGELALLFGPSGVGKSIFAVQLAEALASGRGIEGFDMPAAARNVLYVDLVMSGMQFKRRYMIANEAGREAETFGFARRFFRERPDTTEKLAEWLRQVVKKGTFRVVIIDDLSAIKRTNDGTRETLALMRELKSLAGETGISILAIAGCERQRKGEFTDERHLGRSRVLADAADSVFALGFHPYAEGWRCLVQTRSPRSAPAVWNQSNAPSCRIDTVRAGFPEMRFDMRFEAKMDDETRALVCTIHQMRAEGSLTYQQIADRLEISVSTVGRYLKKWTPSMEPGQAGSGNVEGSDYGLEPSFDEDEKDAAYLAKEEARYLREVCMDNAGPIDRPDDGHTPGEGDVKAQTAADRHWPTDIDVTKIPFAAALGRRSVYDLPVQIDGYGRPCYVELTYDHDGRRRTWYRVNKENIISKFRLLNGTVNVTRLGPAPWLPRD